MKVVLIQCLHIVSFKKAASSRGERSDVGVKSHFYFQFSKIRLDSGELEKCVRTYLSGSGEQPMKTVHK